MIPIDEKNKNKINDLEHKKRQERILKQKKRNKERESTYQNMFKKKTQ